uniref:Uncharacterized protein n=1 Tax=Aureoumbra lagunensis TaxID=44058 RepID=A0A7S3JQQ5_9STRA|mmetsp:Transcript_19066/g.28828  ORF Transcript_19066/g.28828 Transcript_19066/m.28828 type:complete len:660 (+) Transcript_19066:39-2018(+)
MMTNKEEMRKKHRFLDILYTIKSLEARCALSIFGIKGIGFGLMSPWFNKAAKYFLSEMQADAKQRSITVQMASLPWAFRPLIDTMTRRTFGTGRALVFSMIAAAIALILLGSSGGGDSMLTLPMVALLFVTVEVALCAHDVVANGEISRAIRSSPQKAHDIAALVYFVRIGFQVAGLGIVGLALSKYTVQRSFSPGLAGIASALTILVMTTFFYSSSPPPAMDKQKEEEVSLITETEKNGAIEEKSIDLGSSTDIIKKNAEQQQRQNCNQLNNNKQNDCFFLSATFIGTVSVVISSAPLLGIDRPKLMCIASAIAALIGTFGVERTFGREIAMVNAYRMLTHMAQPDIRQTTFIFYTDPASLYPRGPNLDPFFYSAVLGTVARGSALIGVAAYRTFLRDWSFRSVYRLVAQLSCCAQLAALPVYLRLFNAWPRLDLGFILVEEAIRIIVKHLVDIPGMILLARCCRKGNDASVLALCGAARFLSEPVQLYAGILLLSAFGVNPSSRATDGDHLQHLWKVKLLIAFLGLLPLLVLNFMIPPGGNNASTNQPTSSSTSSSAENNDRVCSAPLFRAFPYRFLNLRSFTSYSLSLRSKHSNESTTIKAESLLLDNHDISVPSISAVTSSASSSNNTASILRKKQQQHNHHPLNSVHLSDNSAS